MPRACAGCGAVLSATAKFCSECGTPSASTAAPAAKSRPVATPDGRGPSAVPASSDDTAPPLSPAPGTRRAESQVERRHLTVMFCDLVGSTELSATLDPEDLRDVIGAYQDAAQAAVAVYDGHVAQYLGDGLLIYFGYPRAQEDSARRSVHAALGVIERMGAENRRIEREYGAKLSIRIGIHTGPAVVGVVGSGSADELAIGETPNIAARIQGLAEPNTIGLSGETAKLVRDAFVLEDLGSVPLKGFRGTRRLFRVRGPRAAERDNTPSNDRASAPLVGREGELAALCALWEQAKRGAGRSVLVRGDPGAGKSRLARALRQAAVESGGRYVEARCSTFFTNTAMRPIADMVGAVLSPNEDGNALDLDRIVRGLSRLGIALDESVPYVASLLGVAIPTSSSSTEPLYPQPDLLPQARRAKTVQVVLKILRKAAEETPCVLFVEDLHWVDASTIDVLGALSEAARTSRLLLVMTTRPGFDPPWDVDTEISLNRLPREAVERIIVQIAQKPLPEDVVRQIVLKADGNPLFAEELSLLVLESGLLVEETDSFRPALVPIPPLAIPTTLHDSLMARLDRLTPPHKALVQLCATIGRQVSYELLQEVVRSFEEEMTNELRRLTDGELLYERGVPPRSMFIFRHALIQDAAYGSLVRRTRTRYHARVADVLRARFPDTPAEVLAHHLTEAGRFEGAVAEWHAAGRAALGSFGLAEAVHHLLQGLALVGQIADPSEAVIAEMSLRATLNVPLIFRHGFASKDVEDNSSALLDLCTRAGARGTEEQLVALWGLWQFYEVSARYDRAKEMGDRLMQLALRTGDSAIALAAHTSLGAALLMPGHLDQAKMHFEKGLAIYDMARHKHLALWFGQDAGAMCAAFLTWVHGLDGNEAEAKKRAADAMAMAEALAQPGTQAFVETVLATWCCFDGDPVRAERHADVVVRLAAEQGMPHWEAQAQIARGWGMSQRGQAGESFGLMQRHSQALMGMGARATMSFYFAGIAGAALRAGRLDEARTVLADARAYVESSDERVYEAGLSILEAELALAAGDGSKAEAEKSLLHAVAVAEAQGAHALGRRAKERLASLGHPA